MRTGEYTVFRFSLFAKGALICFSSLFAFACIPPYIMKIPGDCSSGIFRFHCLVLKRTVKQGIDKRLFIFLHLVTKHELWRAPHLHRKAVKQVRVT